MPIIESTGNLVKSGADILVDLNNCVGVSGAGLALAFKKELPDHFVIYQHVCREDGPEPGDAIVILYRDWSEKKNDGFQVPLTVSLFTKGHWRDETRVSWVKDCLENLRRLLDQTNNAVKNHSPRHKPLSVAMAHPGCGLGGLSKSQVRPLIDRHLGNLPNTIFLY